MLLEREKPLKCKACGGPLVLMTEIPEHPQPKQKDHSRVRYFRCERCAQIQIVEEWAALVGGLFYIG